jgi:putative transposase
MAKQAIHDHRVTIRLACQAFKISETCYQYDPKLSSENELIADWLLRLTTTHKQWALACALCIYVTPKTLNGTTSVCIAFTNN